MIKVLGRDAQGALWGYIIFLILTGLPFVICGLLTRWLLSKNQFGEIVAGLIGAWIALFASYLWCWITFFRDVISPTGAGVNFLVGFIITFSPLYIPVLYLSGFVAGHLFDD
jgi:uncharacterized membrane protein YeaQ/YmgE (transglycosylase-associated protein family)